VWKQISNVYAVGHHWEPDCEGHLVAVLDTHIGPIGKRGTQGKPGVDAPAEEDALALVERNMAALIAAANEAA